MSAEKGNRAGSGLGDENAGLAKEMWDGEGNLGWLSTDT